jgi:hypothetical protein
MLYTFEIMPQKLSLMQIDSMVEQLFSDSPYDNYGNVRRDEACLIRYPIWSKSADDSYVLSTLSDYFAYSYNILSLTFSL